MYLLLLVFFISITSAFSRSAIHPPPPSRLSLPEGRKPIGNYRCVLNVYKEEQISDAIKLACTYINNGKRTWGFSRWPKQYQPRNRQQFSFYSNTFRLWPLQQDGKQFKGGFFVTSGNNFIVLDGNCHFAGVVALYRSKPEFRGPCPIIGCHAPDIKEYKNCEVLDIDSNKPLKSYTGIDGESENRKATGAITNHKTETKVANTNGIRAGDREGIGRDREDSSEEEEDAEADEGEDEYEV